MSCVCNPLSTSHMFASTRVSDAVPLCGLEGFNLDSEDKGVWLGMNDVRI